MLKFKLSKNRVSAIEHSNIVIFAGSYDSIQHRLKLVYDYKHLLGNDSEVTQEERSFINGFISASGAITLIRKYEAAIAQAALDDEAIRLEALAHLEELRRKN